MPRFNVVLIFVDKPIDSTNLNAKVYDLYAKIINELSLSKAKESVKRLVEIYREIEELKKRDMEKYGGITPETKMKIESLEEEAERIRREKTFQVTEDMVLERLKGEILNLKVKLQARPEMVELSELLPRVVIFKGLDVESRRIAEYVAWDLGHRMKGNRGFVYWVILPSFEWVIDPEFKKENVDNTSNEDDLYYEITLLVTGILMNLLRILK